MSLRTKKILSTCGLISVAVLWGSAFTFVKAGLRVIDPVSMVGYRFGLAALMLAIFLIVKKKFLWKKFQYGFILGLFLSIAFISQTIGLQYTSAANGGFIAGSFVIFVPFLSWIIGKRPNIYKFLAAGLSVIGLAILTGGIKHANFGDLLVLLSAVGFSSQIVVVDKFVNAKLDLITLAFQEFFVVAVCSFLFAFLFHYDLVLHSTDAIKVILYLALLPTLFAYVIQLFAQQNVSTMRTSLILALEPAVAAVVAWTFGNEHFQFIQLVGGVVMVFAIIVSEVFSGATKKKKKLHFE